MLTIISNYFAKVLPDKILLGKTYFSNYRENVQNVEVDSVFLGKVAPLRERKDYKE